MRPNQFSYNYVYGNAKARICNIIRPWYQAPNMIEAPAKPIQIHQVVKSKKGKKKRCKLRSPYLSMPISVSPKQTLMLVHIQPTKEK
jgi:hypothetical protein